MCNRYIKPTELGYIMPSETKHILYPNGVHCRFSLCLGIKTSPCSSEEISII